MANLYEHTQKGGKLILWLAIPITFEFILIATFVWILNAREKQPMPEGTLFLLLTAISLIPFGVLTLSATMISSLTIAIDESIIRIRFGGGLWKKEFPCMLIESCKLVKPSSFNVGIRWVGWKHWLYNITAGHNIVEITFKNGKKISLGTDDADKLVTAIQSVIVSENPGQNQYFRSAD